MDGGGRGNARPAPRQRRHGHRPLRYRGSVRLSPPTRARPYFGHSVQGARRTGFTDLLYRPRTRRRRGGVLVAVLLALGDVHGLRHLRPDSGMGLAVRLLRSEARDPLQVVVATLPCGAEGAGSADPSRWQSTRTGADQQRRSRSSNFAGSRRCIAGLAQDHVPGSVDIWADCSGDAPRVDPQRRRDESGWLLHLGGPAPVSAGETGAAARAISSKASSFPRA